MKNYKSSKAKSKALRQQRKAERRRAQKQSSGKTNQCKSKAEQAPSPFSYKRKRSKKEKIKVEEPIQVVFGEYDEDCICPICAHTAISGKKVRVYDQDGSYREISPKKPDMMEVFVDPQDSLADFFTHKDKKVQVPVGCSAADFLGFLGYLNPRINHEYGPFGLGAKIDGQSVPSTTTLSSGQIVTVYGEADPDWKAMMNRATA